MKKILITGASGFIGRHAVSRLLNQGCEIHAISRVSSGIIENVHWHQRNIFDGADIDNLIEKIKPSHLLHLAWNVETGYMSSLENFRWVRASMELLEAFQRHGGERVVFAGTCMEYDWRYGCFSEALTPCNASSNYGICKNSLLQMVRAFCLHTTLSFAWGRIFFLFGPYESESRLVATTIKSLLNGQPARCTHGEQYRDFLYVEDVADAFCSLLDSSITDAINIGSGKLIEIRQLVQSIAIKIGRPELLKLGALPTRPGEAAIVYPDISRLTKELLWKPRYTIDEGLDKTINWWRNHLA